MQPNFLLPTITDLLPDDSKDKAPELSEIFCQYFNQSITEEIAYQEIEKLMNNGDTSTKFNDLLSELRKAVQQKPANPIPPAGAAPKLQIALMRKKSRQWTPEEDQRLIDAINSKGTDNWSNIAKIVGEGRTQAQCSQRWHRVLDPKISKSNWSREEEECLIGLVNHFGTKAWTKIAAKMGNRSDVQCRFRYRFLLKKADGNSEQIQPIALPQAMIMKGQEDPTAHEALEVGFSSMTE
ncbi:Myb-like DNA-binding domain containing protein [Tritrichomonas foetus]|uniref:Myb-like DNA-binding domain containing protein n=1 Tax=Tritrichomonas foetus TaxID=1144522 RepID=A0A1J4KQC3_9EUKA|nr:Myb-like DNA-binding domain containing protein [Tritrichomonas foetus]|eukprot:OHT13443.1 Myb-like DNA-binding domain containing protein [Tritrichomonas foetus]